MHVLVATTGPEEREPTDALDGELVVLPGTDEGRGDAGVFRARSRHFVGLDSHADVRVAEVVELAVSPHVVMGYVLESLAPESASDEDRLVALAAQLTAEMLHVADQFPTGTLLDKDGDALHACVPVIQRAGRRPICDPSTRAGGSW